jgi:hypothetical protein
MGLKALATLLAEKKPFFFLIELGAGWALELTRCFGEVLALLLLPRIEPQIFQHIS